VDANSSEQTPNCLNWQNHQPLKLKGAKAMSITSIQKQKPVPVQDSSSEASAVIWQKIVDSLVR
jgi:hypothetical protein